MVLRKREHSVLSLAVITHPLFTLVTWMLPVASWRPFSYYYTWCPRNMLLLFFFPALHWKLDFRYFSFSLFFWGGEKNFLFLSTYLPSFLFFGGVWCVYLGACGDQGLVPSVRVCTWWIHGGRSLRGLVTRAPKGKKEKAMIMNTCFSALFSGSSGPVPRARAACPGHILVSITPLPGFASLCPCVLNGDAWNVLHA